MTYDNLVDDIRFLTKTNSTDYTAAEITRNLNIWYHKVVTMVLRSQDEWDFDDINHADYPILTTPLVASQRSYALPASEKILKLKRVDVCWDGTTNTCYKAEPFDINEDSDGHGNPTDVDGRFSESEPFYDIKYNALFLYPRADAANVSSGGVLRLEWTREIDEFTTSDDTQEPGIDEPFHRMLSVGVAYDYALKEKKKDLVQMLKGELVEYEQRLAEYYGSKQKDRHLVIKSSFNESYGK